MNTDTQQATSALAATSLDSKQSLKTLATFLSKHTEVEIIGHFVDKPLPDAPTMLEHAIGIMVDLEWHQQAENDKIPELDGRITQVGYTVVRMASLRDCKTSEDFLPLLLKPSTHFFRVVEHCHLRNKSAAFKDTEKNPLFCLTRFVNVEDMKAILQDVLNNQRLADGTRAPVILLGHGCNNDETRFRGEWDFRTDKMDGVVCTMKSIGKLAAQAGIILTPDRTKGESLPNFDKMLQGFQIETAGIWRHNGANDAVYQLTLVFLIALFPILFPTASGGYPSDPTIAGQSVNEIRAKLAQGKETMAPLSVGYAKFCFYCETADDHEADACPNKGEIVCELCKNASGKLAQAVGTAQAPKDTKLPAVASSTTTMRAISRNGSRNLISTSRASESCHAAWRLRTSR